MEEDLDNYSFNRFVGSTKIKREPIIPMAKLVLGVLIIYLFVRFTFFSRLPIYFIDGLVIVMMMAFYFNKDNIKKQGMLHHEPLRGHLYADLVFSKKAIAIGSKVYELDAIDTIKFEGYTDFYGALKQKQIADSGALSQGVMNLLLIKTVKGDEVQCHFQQVSRHELRNIRPILETYFFNSKIEMEHLMDILRIPSLNERMIYKEDLQRKRQP
ncbi:MAG: hypothetical protein KBS98_05795 [Flavobacterium sp.]|nr:hypothetical protein [Candidatus Neoflavobacterium equi]